MQAAFRMAQPLLTVRSFLSSLAMLGAIAAAADCDRAPVRGPTDVTTTSASFPQPGRFPASSRTLDNTGFIDNGGRSSDEVSRTEMSGMRVTEFGGQNPVGTPGSGLPLPLGPGEHWPRLPERQTEMRPLPARIREGGVPGSAVASSLTQATCERDAACQRAGERHDWPTGAKCLAGVRDRAREDMEASPCATGFDPSKVATCASALRATPCDLEIDSTADVAECEPEKLCRALAP
jgi:hypothetical protein